MGAFAQNAQRGIIVLDGPPGPGLTYVCLEF